MKTLEMLVNDLKNNLPTINGKSEKQIKFAQDLRYCKVSHLLDLIKWGKNEMADEYLSCINITDEERKECAEADGLTVEEYNKELDSYIETLQLHIILTETNASKIISAMR